MSSSPSVNTLTSYRTFTLLAYEKRITDIRVQLEQNKIVHKGTLMLPMTTFENPQTDETITVWGVTGGDVLSFNHPIHSERDIFVDLRPMVNRDGTVKDLSTVYDLIRRGQLERMFLLDTEGFRRHSKLVVDVFGQWVSSRVARRFGLDDRQRLMLQVIASVYYFSLISDFQDNYSEQELKMNLITQMSRATGIIHTFITEVLDMLEHNEVDGESALVHLTRSSWRQFNENKNERTTPISRLLNTVKSCSIFDNVDLRVDSLYAAVLSGSVLGTNPIELAAICLESPANMFYYVHQSIGKGLYGKTYIGQATNSSVRRHDVKNFDKYFTVLKSNPVKLNGIN